MKKSDINSFEEYLESYLNILRKMNKDEKEKKTNNEQIYVPNFNEENKNLNNLVEEKSEKDVNSKNNFKNEHESEKVDVNNLPSVNKTNEESLKNKNSVIESNKITHNGKNITDVNLKNKVTEIKEMKPTINTTSMNETKSNFVFGNTTGTGSNSGQINLTISESTNRISVPSNDFLNKTSSSDINKTIDDNKTPGESNNLNAAVDINSDSDIDLNYKASTDLEGKLTEFNSTKSIDNFMLSTKSVVNASRDDPEFEIYGNEENHSDRNINNTAKSTTAARITTSSSDISETKQLINTSDSNFNIINPVNDESEILPKIPIDTVTRTKENENKQIIPIENINNSSKNDSNIIIQKQNIVGKTAFEAKDKEANDKTVNSANMNNKDIKENKENKDNKDNRDNYHKTHFNSDKKSKRSSKSKANHQDNITKNFTTNEITESIPQKYKTTKKSHKNSHLHPHTRASSTKYRTTSDESETIITSSHLDKTPEQNQPRKLVQVSVVKNHTDTTSHFTDNTQPTNSAYEKLRKRKEEFEEIEKSNEKPEKKPSKHSDSDNVEYKLYKRVIEISVSLIVIGLFMGILLGIILVTYFNSKK